MSSKREQELERELKKYKQALSQSEEKCNIEKVKRLEEHKKVISLTKKTETLKSRHALFIAHMEQEVAAKVSQRLSSELEADVEKRVEKEIKKKYPKDASSIIEVLQDMDILTS